MYKCIYRGQTLYTLPVSEALCQRYVRITLPPSNDTDNMSGLLEVNILVPDPIIVPVGLTGGQ